MQKLIVAGTALLGLAQLGLSGVAGAQTLSQSIQPQTKTVEPPSNRPHAFTPAPVPSVDAPTVAPSNRAGNADDAGPTNATPFSGDLSAGLSSNPAARSVRQTAPTADAVPNIAPPGHE